MATEVAQISAAGTRSLSQRKRPLAPIQTNFSPDPLVKVSRPPPVETVIYNKPGAGDRAPADTRLSRRTSRNFLGLFAKKQSSAELRPRTSPASSAKPPASPVKETVQTPTTPSASSRRSPVNESPRKKKEPSPRQTTHWDPPPLFQAYPQSLKHSTLFAPTIPAATVLRNRKKADDARRAAEEAAPATADDSTGKPTVIKKARTIEEPPVTCVNKVYVLATSGYLLQYPASGAHDRRPERVLRLGRDSAAFASDAIPGRHWVLQVNSASTEDGTATGTGIGGVTPARSVFARLAGRRVRREVTSLLLVMPAADEMDAWLVAIRRLIQSLGGQAYNPDVKVPGGAADAAQKLQSRPSRRFVIRRDLTIESPTDGGLDSPGIRTATMSSITTDRAAVPLRQPGPGESNRPAPVTARLRPAPSTTSLDSDLSYPTPTPELTHASSATASTPRSSLASAAPSKRASRVEPLQPYNPIIDQKPPSTASGSIGLPELPTKGSRPLSFPAAHVQPDHASAALPNFSVPFSSHRFSQTFKASSPTSTLGDASQLPAPSSCSPTESNREPNPAKASASNAQLPGIVPVTPTGRSADHPDRFSSLDHAYGLLPWVGSDEPAADDEEAPAAAESLAWGVEAEAEPAPAPEPGRKKSLNKRHSAYDLPTHKQRLKSEWAAPARVAEQPNAPKASLDEASLDSCRASALGPLPALPKHVTSTTQSPPRKLRRPASMQVRPEATRSAAIPPRLPSSRSNMALRPISMQNAAGGTTAKAGDRPRKVKGVRASIQGMPTPPPPPKQPLPDIPSGVPLVA